MTTTPPDPEQPFGGSHPPYGAYAPGAGWAEAQRQAPPAPPQPRSIALAVKLMWVGAALSVLSLIYTFTTLGTLKDDLRQQLIDNGSNPTQSELDVAFGVGVGVAVLSGVVGACLWLWTAWKNGQGRGWARIVATVFAGLNLVSVLFAVATGSTEPLAIVMSSISVVLAAVILILLWRKESSQFYEGTAASRRLY